MTQILSCAVDPDRVRERPGVEVVPDLADEVAVAVEFEQLRGGGGIGGAGRVAAVEDEDMAAASSPPRPRPRPDRGSPAISGSWGRSRTRSAARSAEPRRPGQAVFGSVGFGRGRPPRRAARRRAGCGASGSSCLSYAGRPGTGDVNVVQSLVARRADHVRSGRPPPRRRQRRTSWSGSARSRPWRRCAAMRDEAWAFDLRRAEVQSATRSRRFDDPALKRRAGQRHAQWRRSPTRRRRRWRISPRRRRSGPALPCHAVLTSAAPTKSCAHSAPSADRSRDLNCKYRQV